MGRKSNASKNNDKTPTAENTHPYQEKVEHQPSNVNIKSPRALNSQLENQNPRCSPLKHPSLSMDGVQTHHEKIVSQEHVNQDHEHQKKYATFIRKKSNFRGASVRRSERIKSAVVQTPKSKHGIEYIEDVTLSDSEKDEPDNQMEQVLPEPELEPEPVLESEPEPAENSSGKSLDEKVDYVLQRMEALDKTIELLKSKVDGNVGFYEAPPMTSISYRSMYIDSQKKLEALTVENRQLTGKLENALGKVEVYEKQIRVLIDALDKTKDTVNAVVVSNLTKTTETAVHASAQAFRNACSVSTSKRKRN